MPYVYKILNKHNQSLPEITGEWTQSSKGNCLYFAIFIKLHFESKVEKVQWLPEGKRGEEI